MSEWFYLLSEWYNLLSENLGECQKRINFCKKLQFAFFQMIEIQLFNFLNFSTIVQNVFK